MSRIKEFIDCKLPQADSEKNAPQMPAQFEILAKLAESRSSVVFKARQTLSDRIVAIKVLSSRISGNQTDRERFLREAKTTCLLEHKNIVKVFSLGLTTDARPYLVMEYIAGKTLAQTLDDTGSLDLSQFCRVIQQVAAALQYTHERGYLHRDLKPENIMILDESKEDMSVKLLDFGIASNLDRAVGQSYTQTGQIIGSPHYMSPEQCLSRALSPQSDIYALGVVMYRAVTGSVPFSGDTPHLIMLKHVSEEIPSFSRSARKRFPKAILALIRECLQKEERRRPCSAAYIQEQVQKIQSRESERSHRARKLRSFRKFCGLLCLAITSAAMSAELASSYALLLKSEESTTNTSGDSIISKHAILAEIAAAERQFHLNRFAEAGEIYDAVLPKVRKLKLSENDHTIANKLLHKVLLGRSWCKRKLASALGVRDCLQEALAAARSAYGSKSSQVAETEIELAVVLLTEGPLTKATVGEIESLCQSSIEFYRQRISQTNQEDPFLKIVVQGQISRDYSKLSGTMSIQGLAYELAGRISESVAIQKEALRTRRAGCDDDLSTAWILERLCRVYHKAGRESEKSASITELLGLINNLEGNQKEKQFICDDLLAFLAQYKKQDKSIKLIEKARSALSP